ncbi:response regulator transcription factor [Paenibacillus sp. FSL H7-0716]|uniref:DNA-binding response regulator n=1 Tax=Paenibacillus odorifer TaxID=189426 RepID=A0A1R0YUW7_9BACL|nr:response regulator transcription factor [Paenibacillus odorifer]AWV32431.1 DNA-binding response regulator [Paenibacillus odorifer]OME11165.1 DNA-binding response regulator [Paenibacillus odorifer]OME13437.1 DNA-binding response regulator [Paenibacillus odorifer]
MDKIIRIVLADDQPFVRQGLRYIIDSQPDMECVGEACDGEEAYLVSLETKPDIVLMDIQMPNSSGLEATRKVLRVNPEIKIVLLTTFDVQAYVIEGIRAGAVGYLLKDTDMQEVLAGIRWANQGNAIYRTPTASKALIAAISSDAKLNKTEQASDDFSESLTERELDVLQQMAYGRRNSEIAEILNISQGTVKTHIHRILQKLEVEDRTQAVVLAIRTGMVE